MHSYLVQKQAHAIVFISRTYSDLKDKTAFNKMLEFIFFLFILNDKFHAWLHSAHCKNTLCTRKCQHCWYALINELQSTQTFACTERYMNTYPLSVPLFISLMWFLSTCLSKTPNAYQQKVPLYMSIDFLLLMCVIHAR